MPATSASENQGCGASCCSPNANKIIACELGIKESTVKAHITAILRKLRVHSRTQAVTRPAS